MCHVTYPLYVYTWTGWATDRIICLLLPTAASTSTGLDYHAYPNVQNISIFRPESSSTYGGGSANVTFSPCSSATFPVSPGSESSCATALVAVDMGVITMDLNSARSEEMLVSVYNISHAYI